MKKYLAILPLLFFISCSWHRGRIVTGLEGKSLPEFNLTLADSVTPFSTKSIPAGKPFLVLYYRPNCTFCQAQTTDIVKHIKNLDGLTIYMVSASSSKEIQGFVEKFNLSRYTGIKIIEDAKSQMSGYFQPDGVPFLAFYDAKGRLKEARLGKQDIGV